MCNCKNAVSRLVHISKIRVVLHQNSVIAVVGLSPKLDRPSHQVARYLQQVGYHIIPVNPGQKEILGQTCYPDLNSVPDEIDIVNIFRRSELVLPVVQEAIAHGVKAIWMQEGIINEDAARLAEHHGIAVIMDRCIKIDHQNLF